MDDAAMMMEKAEEDKMEAEKMEGGMCCMAMTLKCLKCAMGSKMAVCEKFPRLPGCKEKMCCKAMTYECMKCSMGGHKKVCKAYPDFEECQGGRLARFKKRAAKRAMKLKNRLKNGYKT